MAVLALPLATSILKKPPKNFKSHLLFFLNRRPDDNPGSPLVFRSKRFSTGGRGPLFLHGAGQPGTTVIIAILFSHFSTSNSATPASRRRQLTALQEKHVHQDWGSICTIWGLF
ncbi:hypothetical protein CDL12_02223 [Handroanthus impetiginosus]|uniref:Uncharacterized protein n=1 Tax=Handroanthus impetiginosus TaxID=429701 RepID=A0A2G9I5L7_9LAMI|nr:hypothetical protein CDL12_02223 [Handroanthus impetiginosus]